MKLATSLLLGSAAGLAVVSGAQAADLPVRKAAPVDYVRICSPIPGGGGSNLGAGTGFFYIPGTDTCLNVGGRVRAEYRYITPFQRGNDTSGFRARGLIALDARTATAYGTLRTFIRYELTRNTGNYTAGTAAAGIALPSAGPADAIRLERAFIQFGGLTVGKTLSFFDAFGTQSWGGMCTMGDSGCASAEPVVFAYTFTFGGGFSGTISVEDPSVHRLGGTGIIANNLVYAGMEVPDIIGRLEYQGAWGQAWLTAAAHQIRTLNAGPFGTLLAANNSDDEWGFAVQGALKVNLPMLGAGDALYLAGVYTNGAASYGMGNGGGQFIGQSGNTPFNTVADGWFNAAGELEKTTTFGGHGALWHYWSPQWRSLFFGGVTFVEFDTQTVGGNLLGLGGLRDHHLWNVGGSLIWSPVRALDIGVEVVYRKIDYSDSPLPLVPTNTFPFASSHDAIEVRARVQRDF